MTDPTCVCQVQGGPVPAYAHPQDAGADLCASVDDILPARSRKLIPTGIRLALPPGHVGLVWPRSGLALRHGLDCGAGVIDAQYRGEVRVLLFNHSDTDLPIKKGDRIAQLLVQKVERVQFLPVEELDETIRGANGFGSTG